MSDRTRNGEAASEIAGAERAAASRGESVIAWIVRKLETERLENEAPRASHELGWRQGWNARAESLLRELRVRIGLAELAASDVDGRLDDGGPR